MYREPSVDQKPNEGSKRRMRKVISIRYSRSSFFRHVKSFSGACFVPWSMSGPSPNIATLRGAEGRDEIYTIVYFAALRLKCIGGCSQGLRPWLDYTAPSVLVDYGGSLSPVRPARNRYESIARPVKMPVAILIDAGNEDGDMNPSIKPAITRKQATPMTSFAPSIPAFFSA